MAVTKLDTLAPEQGTYVITVAFTDEDGIAVVPVTMVWSLRKRSDSAIVNSRESVEISPLDSTSTIVLSGLDLERFGGNDGGERRVTLEGTYNSNLGNGLEFTSEVEFQIDEYLGI
jgi:hypothetical protein